MRRQGSPPHSSALRGVIHLGPAIRLAKMIGATQQSATIVLLWTARYLTLRPIEGTPAEAGDKECKKQVEQLSGTRVRVVDWSGPRPENSAGDYYGPNHYRPHRTRYRGRHSVTARVASLDLLRGAAAFTVVIPHYAMTMPGEQALAEIISILGLEIFFVLSGYVWRQRSSWWQSNYAGCSISASSSHAAGCEQSSPYLVALLIAAAYAFSGHLASRPFLTAVEPVRNYGGPSPPL
ncbi:hypothetical protein ABIF63_000213 [Bradyrhizobium japonicum]|uniref:Uncharacterized protein n=2 Tax=Bradyrhizobium japonicum TaxID=375 RepID=A0ABV2RII1_BRAJP